MNKSNLDIDKVNIKIMFDGPYNEWLDENIIHLGTITLSYDNGKEYPSFLFFKELVCEYENSLITIFFEALFKKYGKDMMYYYNEEMEGFNLPKSKVNEEYNETYSMFDLVKDIFNKNNISESNLIVHNGNLNINANWPYGFTTVSTIGHFYHNKYEYKSFVEKKIKKRFLFLNKMAKHERYELYTKLKQRGILNNCYYTINALKDPMFKDSVSLEDTAPSIEDGMNLMQELYDTTFINIISESEFYNNRKDLHCYKTIFFTEKIAKALNTFSPFILLACSGSLQKLKELGFKTFSKWWNESYDDELNDTIRIEKIAKLINDVNKLSNEDIEKMYKEMIPTLIHNSEHYQKFTDKNYQYKLFLPGNLINKKCFYI